MSRVACPEAPGQCVPSLRRRPVVGYGIAGPPVAPSRSANSRSHCIGRSKQRGRLWSFRERALSPLSAKRSTHSPHPRRATRVDTVANGRRAVPGRVLRSSWATVATRGHTRGLGPVTSPRAPALFTRPVDVAARWLSSKLSSARDVDLPSRAESAHFVRRGWDSNPREPCGSSGFQDRRIRPLCHPSGWRNANKPRAFPPVSDAVGTAFMP